MKKLEIVYEGGYRQVSKYLTLEHDANFSLIIDAIINVYNMNLTKLVTIGRHRAVKVSNGFLSRQTGLGISIIKTNVKKIEELGLITAIKKGQGNTRHYVINVENINSYIAALQPKFEQWFEKSLEASKKDKARSVEADDNKLKKGQQNFENTIAKLATFTKESKIGLVENRPTQTVETDQPNRLKATVADIAKETTKNITKKTNPSSSKRGAIPKSNQQTTRDELKEGIQLYNLGEISSQQMFLLLTRYIPGKAGHNWKMSTDDEGYIKHNLSPVSREYMTATLEYIDTNVERMISGERKMRFGSLLAGIREKAIEAGIGAEMVSSKTSTSENKKMFDTLPDEETFDFEDSL